MTEEDSYISTLLFCAEQIKAGCTSIAEPGGQFVSGMAKAISQAGIRGKLAKSVMNCGEGLPKSWQHTTDEELAIQEEDLKKFHNTADGRVKVWFGIRTIFNATDELLLRTKELADKYGVGVHMHIAEAKAEVDYARVKVWFGIRTIFNATDELLLRTKELADKYGVGVHMHIAEAKAEVDYAKETRGATTVTHLNNLGFLDKNIIAAHAVWLSNEEVERGKSRGRLRKRNKRCNNRHTFK